MFQTERIHIFKSQVSDICLSSSSEVEYDIILYEASCLEIGNTKNRVHQYNVSFLPLYRGLYHDLLHRKSFC